MQKQEKDAEYARLQAEQPERPIAHFYFNIRYPTMDTLLGKRKRKEEHVIFVAYDDEATWLTRKLATKKDPLDEKQYYGLARRKRVEIARYLYERVTKTIQLVKEQKP